MLDEYSIVSKTQLTFWKWMADYYVCAEGDVMNAALPSGFRLESETSIILHSSISEQNPRENADFSHLSDKEYLVAEAMLVEHELSIDEVSKILLQKTVYPVIQSLLKKI